jgi:hypothetical protein
MAKKKTKRKGVCKGVDAMKIVDGFLIDESFMCQLRFTLRTIENIWRVRNAIRSLKK